MVIKSWLKLPNKWDLKWEKLHTDVPDNVKTNENYYQTNNSDKSSGSQQSSKGKGTDSSTANSPGSNGGPNKAKDPKKTQVNNHNKTSKDVTHGNMPDKVKKEVLNNIEQVLTTNW